MQNKSTLLLIALAILIALLISGWQYYKNNRMTKLFFLLFFLRFIAIFTTLLLLINPKLEQVTYSNEKPNLVLMVDNSNSIDYLKQTDNVKKILSEISDNKALQNKFNINTYTFGKTLKSSDSLTFTDKSTNISDAFGQLTQIYKQTVAPTVFISDGNQTYGSDFEYAYQTYKQPVYAVILGDTITYSDLKIQQLNVNKYAFLNNKFPVETILVYAGNASVKSKFTVSEGKSVVFSEEIQFTKQQNTRILNYTIPANSIGVHQYKATITPLDNERNTINNSKNFAIEVIDQKTKIAIVSDFIHPDLGAIKKSIEHNEQRFVQFLNPKEILGKINEFQLIILYQPNSSFKEVYEKIEKERKNKFVIIGSKTDLNVVNTLSKNYRIEITNKTEDYQAQLNKNYAPFIVNAVQFENFPPLLSVFGSVKFLNPIETILYKTVNGIATNEALLSTFELNGSREALLLGENIWRWRAESYVIDKNFTQFDDFMGKLVQYLAENKVKSRLNVDYQSFYNDASEVLIIAEYFNKNYEFDPRENIEITVKNKVTNASKTYPLLLNGNSFQVDLSNLSAGDYSFTVLASPSKLSKSGNFTILEYNAEQQFLNANVTGMQNLSKNSHGNSYFVNNTSHLISDLLNNNKYAIIQKEQKKTLPLIDWKYLLLLMVLSLSAEWFIRKYNGLI